jgi:hypothetical protein
MDSLTQEWLECYRDDKANGENPADHIFWRLALDVLPEGVNPNDPQVIAAIAEIRTACEKRDGVH